MDNRGFVSKDEDLAKVDESGKTGEKGLPPAFMNGDHASVETTDSADTLTMEEVYEMTGGMGVYQQLAFLLIGIFSALAPDSINMTFVGGDQDHWCHIPELSNLTHSNQTYIGIPIYDDAYDECWMFDLNYTQFSTEDFLDWNRSAMVDEDTPVRRCSDGWVYDQSVFVNTITAKMDLVCSDSWMLTLVSTVYMGGVLTGAVLSGFLSDKWGRKKVIYGSIWLKLVATFMTTFPVNYPWVVVTRFALGVGSTGCYLTGFILFMELINNAWRGFLGICYQVQFAIGFMLWPAFAYFIRDDVKLQLVVAIPLVFLLPMWWVLDESPRWLLINDRYEEADATLRKIARVNKATLPKDFSVHRIQKDIPVRSSKTCLDLLKSKTMRWRTLIADFHWFTDSLMYYVLSLNTGTLSGDVFVNTVLAGAVEIPACILAVFALNWKYTGRRLTCSFSLLIAGAASLISIYLILEDHGNIHTAFAMVAKGFVTVGFNSIYVYTAELFPTEVRNVGVGTASMCARVSGMAAPYVGGPLANVWSPLPPLVCGILAVISGLLTLLLPETLGKQLFTTMEEAEAFGKRSRANTTTSQYKEEKDHIEIEKF